MNDIPRHTRRIVAQIAPLLDGYPLNLQGVVLADLMAIYLYGIPENAREGLLELHCKTVRSLVKEYEKMLCDEVVKQ